MIRKTAMKISFEKLTRLLDEAVKAKFGKFNRNDCEYWRYYVLETFDDYVIARGDEDKLYRIPYSLKTDQEDVELGEPQEVETAYIPVKESAHFLVGEAAGGDDWTFPVEAIRAGWAGGTVDGAGDLPHYYTREFVAEVAEALNGAKFGRRHPAPGSIGADDPERIAGYFSDGQLVSEAARGNLHLLKNETELQGKLKAAREAGKLDMFGLSILGYVGFKPGKVDGKAALISTRLGKLMSVDLCAEAGAGGRFLVAASANTAAEISQLQQQAIKTSPANGGETGGVKGAGRNHGGAMKERIAKVLEALRKLNAGRANELQTKFDGLAEDKHADFLLEVTEAVTTAAAEATTANNSTAAAETLKLVQEALQETKLIQAKNLVETKLADSKLPAPAMALVREHLKDRVVTEAEVDGEIKRVREAFAAFSNVGRVSSSGTAVTLDSADKVQLAMDQLLGVKESAGKGVAPFTSLREAYSFVTGDINCTFGANGGFLRTSEAIAMADFPNLLKNSMTKLAIQDYREIGMNGLDLIYTVGKPITDFKTQERVRDGYFGDIPVVAEGGLYQELAKPTDELISFAVSKRGGLLTISEETIRTDDLGKVSGFPKKIARAGRRTLKQYITNFVVNNPLYDGDGVAVFAAGHSNLGAAALSVTELNARAVALFKQTEKDSNKPLGLMLHWLMIPVELRAIAYAINQSEQWINGGVGEANPWYHAFGANNERIIVNELLTDANDWYYGASKDEAPCIEIGFLDGVQEPQILLANDPKVGLMLTNDQIVFKTKHAFGGDVIDYRGIGKAVVA